MKRGAIHLAATLAVAAALAALTGLAAYRGMRTETEGIVGAGASPGPAGLDWMRAEYGLDGARMARIAALHEAHQVVCAAHCAEILRVRAREARLETEGASAAEREATRAEARRIDDACRASVEAHLLAVAEVMGGEAGERYLRALRARVARSGHGHVGEAGPGSGRSEENEHDRGY